MSVEVEGGRSDLEREKLALERLKIRLDYRKFVLGSVFVAIAIAAIPPLFQLATAGLEYVKTQQERKTQQQAFRDTYVKEFLTSAVNQDIELRIRFAEYFSFVSTDKESWTAYKDELFKRRKAIREQIDIWEKQWQQKVRAKDVDQIELDQLERNLAWAYKEVGYVERNRSVASNPRAPDSRASTASVPIAAETLVKLFEPLANRKGEVEGLLSAFAEFCDGDANSAAMFLALVLHETNYLRSSGAEKLEYTAERLMQIWPSRFETIEKARQYAGNPEAIANHVYAGILGNKEKADGFMFRGRGYIGITGRANYRQIGVGLGVALEENPDELITNKTLDARASAFWVCRISRSLRGGGSGSEGDLMIFWKRAIGGPGAFPPGLKNIYDRIRLASFATAQ